MTGMRPPTNSSCVTPQCSATGSPAPKTAPNQLEVIRKLLRRSHAARRSPWSWRSQLTIRFQLMKIRLTHSNLLIPNTWHLHPKQAIEPGMVATGSHDGQHNRPTGMPPRDDGGPRVRGD